VQVTVPLADSQATSHPDAVPVVSPLAGRTAVVTGGSRGIGRAIASALTAAGVRTVIIARDATVLEAAASEIGAHPIAADMADPAEVDRAIDEVVLHLGGTADIIVNAAGAFTLAPVADTPVAVFDAMLATNVRAPFTLVHAMLPSMIERGSGHIVSIGSVAGRNAFAGNGAYASSKFAVRGLHAVLDAELRGTGVRSTLIEPAATDTGLWDQIDQEKNPGLPSRGAMLRPEAVADAVLFALTRAPDVAIRNIILERS
jgi:NADP-dependent 3-hydroxy acid dehydrogenase YdfG